MPDDSAVWQVASYRLANGELLLTSGDGTTTLTYAAQAQSATWGYASW